jgi:hypothetical protein
MFIVYRNGEIVNQVVSWGADRERDIKGTKSSSPMTPPLTSLEYFPQNWNLFLRYLGPYFLRNVLGKTNVNPRTKASPRTMPPPSPDALLLLLALARSPRNLSEHQQREMTPTPSLSLICDAVVISPTLVMSASWFFPPCVFCYSELTGAIDSPLTATPLSYSTAFIVLLRN